MRSSVPELVIPSRTISPGTLVTARSFLIDRVLPDCEIVALPEKAMKGGVLTWEVGPLVARPEKENRLKKLISAPQVDHAPEGRWLYDMRPNSPSNWAHFLNNHLPMFFAVADAAGLDPAEALLVLPKDIPGYIREAARLFGLETHLSDAVVEGHGVTTEVRPWGALRSGRKAWMDLPAPRAALAAILAEAPATPLPKKVFLTRSKTRTLQNFPEIEPVLAARGFETVLPESLSPADQIRLFLGAEEMVAIHGAGLAPLLFCTPEQGPKRLIEILPCGHMTNVYRAIAEHTGCRWIGVRGRLKPEYVAPAYQLDKTFVQYSLDSFEVDPVSLERAFEMTDV